MQPHRSSALGYASAASAAHSRVYGACAAEAAASETSGLSVGGCPRAWRYFGPHPVRHPLLRKFNEPQSHVARVGTVHAAWPYARRFKNLLAAPKYRLVTLHTVDCIKGL